MNDKIRQLAEDAREILRIKSPENEFEKLYNEIFEDQEIKTLDLLRAVAALHNPIVEEAEKMYQELKRQEYDNTDVYNDLTIDNSGEDIYLGDGIWISSNGTMHDDL